jgi:hypothetical protein
MPSSRRGAPRGNQNARKHGYYSIQQPVLLSDSQRAALIARLRQDLLEMRLRAAALTSAQDLLALARAYNLAAFHLIDLIENPRARPATSAAQMMAALQADEPELSQDPLGREILAGLFSAQRSKDPRP